MSTACAHRHSYEEFTRHPLFVPVFQRSSILRGHSNIVINSVRLVSSRLCGRTGKKGKKQSRAYVYPNFKRLHMYVCNPRGWMDGRILDGAGGGTGSSTLRCLLSWLQGRHSRRGGGGSGPFSKVAYLETIDVHWHRWMGCGAVRLTCLKGET